MIHKLMEQQWLALPVGIGRKNYFPVEQGSTFGACDA